MFKIFIRTMELHCNWGGICMNTILETLGRKIRLYRKANGMSLEDLAAKIYKIKASVSKYELGQTAMDILTLSDIATALGMMPFQLLETDVQHHASSSSSANHPFGKTNQLYMYHMVNQKLYLSLLRFGHMEADGRVNVTLYHKIKDPQNIERCTTLYHGYMYNHDVVISFFLRNYHNTVENVLLNVAVPTNNSSIMTGMACGLDDSLAPLAIKVVLSQNTIEESPKLYQAVSLTAESIKAAKKTNCLTFERQTNNL